MTKSLFRYVNDRCTEPGMRLTLHQQHLPDVADLGVFEDPLGWIRRLKRPEIDSCARNLGGVEAAGSPPDPLAIASQGRCFRMPGCTATRKNTGPIDYGELYCGFEAIVRGGSVNHRWIRDCSTQYKRHGSINWNVTGNLMNCAIRDILRIRDGAADPNGQRFDPEECPMVCSLPIDRTKRCTERCLSCLLEGSNDSPACIIADAPVCALLATGRCTGIVVDMGHTSTTVSIVENGHATKFARLDVGGVDVTAYMVKLLKLTPSGSPFSTYDQLYFDQRRQMEKLMCEICRVVRSKDEFERLESLYLSGTEPREYNRDFPRQRQKPVNFALASLAPEALLRPSLIFGDSSPTKDLAETVIGLVNDSELEEQLLGNVLVTGGSSSFRGLPWRVQQALQELHPNPKPVVFASRRKHLSWFGASLIPSFPTLAEGWMVRGEEFDEYGPEYLLRKKFFTRPGDAAFAELLVGGVDD